MGLLKPFKKAKKCSDIMSRIHFLILGKIVNLLSTVLFPKQTERYIFEFLHNIVLKEFSVFPSVLV